MMALTHEQELAVRKEALRRAERHRQRFLAEAERLKAEVRARDEETILRIEALSSLHRAPLGEDDMETSPEDEVLDRDRIPEREVLNIDQIPAGTADQGPSDARNDIVDPVSPPIVRTVGNGVKRFVHTRDTPDGRRRYTIEGEPMRDLQISLKHSEMPWTEDDDYLFWKAKMLRYLTGKGCLFLCKVGEMPMLNYTQQETFRLSHMVMSVILSNLPEKHQKLLIDCQSPREMFTKMDKIITPPSQATEYTLQMRFMSLTYVPEQMTVTDFQSLVEEYIRKIRRCPEAELTERQIRRNVLSAIADSCPQIYQDALEDTSVSLGKIFDRMQLKSAAKEETLRRNREASSSALLTNLSDRFGRKRPHNSPFQTHQKLDEVCFKCGQTGHWRRDCTFKEKRCFNCRSENHMSPDCPKPETEKTRTLRNSLRDQAKRRKYSLRKKNNGYWKNKKNQQQTQNSNPGCSKTAMKSVVVAVNKSNQNAQKKKKQSKKKANVEGGTAAIAVRRGKDEDEISIGSAFSLYDGNLPQLRFIIDSGATEHIVKDITVFTSLRTLKTPVTISCAKNDRGADMLVSQAGDIVVFNEVNRKYSILRDVLFAPTLFENLFSLKKLMKRGLVAQFGQETLLVVDSKSSEVLKKGFFAGNFWWLTFSLPLLGASLEKRDKVLQALGGGLSLMTSMGAGSKEQQTESGAGSSEQHADWHTQGRTAADEVSDDADLPSVSVRKRDSRSMEENTEVGGPSKRSRLDSVIELGESTQNELRTDQEAVRLRDSVGLKWHHRLNHASKKYLDIAGKVIPELKGIKFGSEVLDCADCKLAKSKRKACSEKRRRSNQPFHRLYSDLAGPVKPAAFRSQSRYIVTFTDDASRYAFAYEICDKTRVNLALAQCLADIRKLMGPQMRVAELRVDGGLEYKTAEMRSLLDREQIAMTVCEPYTPQHNGTAERLNLELEEKIRVNLISSGIPMYLWAYATRHVLYVHNRTPNAANNFQSPYEVVMKQVPVVKYLRRFGCEAYILNNKAKSLPKFEARAEVGFLIECGDTGYTLFHFRNQVIVRSKNVDFVEDRTYKDYVANSNSAPHREDSRDFEVGEQLQTTEGAEMPNSEPQTSEPLSAEDSLGDRSQGDNQSRTTGKKPVRELESADRSTGPVKIGSTNEFDFFEEEDEQMAGLVLSAMENVSEEPSTFKEAMESSEAEQWKEAVNQEFEAIERCDTWKIVSRSAVPHDRKVMKTRWVHKRKNQVDGTVRYRSRLVVKGFADNHHYDLSEIYAPVARLPDVRFMLIVAAKYDLELTQLDVKTAFLNGSLDKLVYVEIPEGYTEYLGETQELKRTSVCEVHKALYGLKVSPRRWFVRYLEAVEKLDFRPYNYQPCLFIWNCGEKLAIMLLYVDDILVASNCPEKLTQVKALLEKEFSITDLGEPKKFLGMEIERNRSEGTIRIHQKSHIENMLRKFDPDSTIVYSTPMIEASQRKKVLCEDASENWDREAIPYRQAIGTLLYLQNGTRPDISFAVNLLSRYQSNFTEQHWEDVIRILRYLRGSKDLGLEFKPSRDSIDCFVDASLGLSADGGFSTTGFVIYLFGSPVTWRTKKQNHVALSSAEAEFVAMSTACRELASLRTMCSEILSLCIVPTVHEDSRPAIRLAEVDDSSTLKHLVRLSYLYVREEHKQGHISIEWINTEKQVADTFTKPLARSKFIKFRHILMSSLQ